MTDKKPADVVGYSGSTTQFDYDDSTYVGVGERLWNAYKTLRVYDIFHAPGSKVTSKVTKLELGESQATPFGKIIGTRATSTDKGTGYRYTNSGETFNTMTPAIAAAMKNLKAFLEANYVEPAESDTSDLRRLWKAEPGGSAKAPDNWKRYLQRLIVSCFDSQSLVHAQFKNTPKEAYQVLCNGLVDKTHRHGFAGPHHMDVVISIVNLHCLPELGSAPSALFPDGLTSDSDATKGYVGTKNLARYVTNIGLMCSGLVGSFARYATNTGRPGRFDEDGLQIVDGTLSVRPCFTTGKQKADPALIPARWNLSGMEGAGAFGQSAFAKNTKDISPVGLTRETLGSIRPGDFVVFQTISHVAIIDDVALNKKGDELVISTVESLGEQTPKNGLVTGILHSKGLTLRATSTPKKFEYNHAGIEAKQVRMVEVRRLNHWGHNDPLLPPAAPTGKVDKDGKPIPPDHSRAGTQCCNAGCPCFRRHDLTLI